MLFSALPSRTIGKGTNMERSKFPELVDFFLKEIVLQESQYPPLYPIVLLLSRMVPTDKFDDQKVLARVMPMLDKLTDCLNNKNYLGRLMVSKAIFTFLQL